MNRNDALDWLGLSAQADTPEIRTALFQRYAALFHQTALGEKVWAEHLMELMEIRDLLMDPPDSKKLPLAASPLAQAPHQLLSSAQLPAFVYVLLYRHSGDETIHTLRFSDYDVVLAFENEFTARKYTQSLLQNQFDQPWAEPFATPEIIEFCENSGYGLLIVPMEQVVQPPVGVAEDLEDF